MCAEDERNSSRHESFGVLAMRTRNVFLDLFSPGLARVRREGRPKPTFPPAPAPRPEPTAANVLQRASR